jgi:hypothetical protein
MGLYDTIHIPKKFLPLTKQELEFVESEDFQTKSFGQLLLEFRVNEDKMFEFNWRSDELKEIEKDTWEMIPLTDAVHFSVYFTNELERVDLLAVFENGKLRTVKRVVGFNEALNKPKPKKVISKPKKSVLELSKEIPKGRYKGLSEIVNQEYEYVKVKKDEI